MPNSPRDGPTPKCFKTPQSLFPSVSVFDLHLILHSLCVQSLEMVFWLLRRIPLPQLFQRHKTGRERGRLSSLKCMEISRHSFRLHRLSPQCPCGLELRHLVLRARSSVRLGSCEQFPAGKPHSAFPSPRPIDSSLHLRWQAVPMDGQTCKPRPTTQQERRITKRSYCSLHQLGRGQLTLTHTRTREPRQPQEPVFCRNP